ncbi:uncharacterized protein HD556DRAFT_1304511 [Suillus plorans]|uniref:Uncharacterized protein n=1 Tax=Suillus plorans TaxID=116603 RepID=A0A9P7J3Z2_9AGAM|nr:uncharacterized protein HD556DRAFT_1304511 [Suillus plorans]KAG1801396.1 hypothetical protein HD556DRAFT_1304511 [Suillus plorans]
MWDQSTKDSPRHRYTQAANAGKFLSIILALIHRPGLKKIRGLVTNAGLKKIRGLVTNAGLKKIRGLVANAGNFQSTGRASKRFEDWFLMLIRGLVPNAVLIFLQYKSQLVVNLPKSTRLLSTTCSKLGYYYIMGRPRLYHTSQDKIEAARSYRKKYYAKRRRNSAIISKKNRQKSCKQHNCPTNNDVDSQSCSRYSVRTRSSQRHPWQEDLTSAEAALADIIGGSSRRLLDGLVNDLCGMEGIQQRLRLLHGIILQAMGTGEELQRVDLISHQASSLILALEDLLMHVMVDPRDALEGHTRVRLSMCDPLWVDITTTPYMAEPEESVTVYEGSVEFDEAVYAMADECFIFSYLGIFYNMPAKRDLEPPFYCVTYGRYIGVFPSYLW